MKEAGLEWIPYKAPAGIQVSLGLTDEEFRRQYGWGISTLVDVYVPGSDARDPNQAFAMSLSPEARDAYGKQYSHCRRRVAAEIGLRPGTVQFDQKVHRAYQEAIERSNADPRLSAAKAQYAECMSASGYQATSGEALNAHILERFREYQIRFQRAAAEWVQQGKQRSALRLSNVFNAEEIRDIRGIQQYELAAGWADWECGKLLYPVAEALQKEYVERFLNGET